MLSKKSVSSFTIITTFIVLSIIGFAVMPLLNLRLYPGKSKPGITVSYSMRGANAVVIDSEVTSKLEGVLSRIEGVQRLSSRTGSGSGSISLEMDKNEDMDAVRFEVSTLIRQVYPTLPLNVSYPALRVNRPDEDNEKVETLLTFTFNGPGNRSKIGDYANEYIVSQIAEIQDIHSVNVYGSSPRQIDLLFDKEKLKNIGLSEGTIISQIHEYFVYNNLGSVQEQSFMGDVTHMPVVLSGLTTEKFDPQMILIKHEQRLFPLANLVKSIEHEREPDSYYRINGLNTINIVVRCVPRANQMVAAQQVKAKVNQLRNRLPEDYSINISYDSSVQIKEELSKIIFRILSSLFILLFFVLLVSRSGRYMLIITLSIVSNILIAFILYYWLKIEIHMYSLAGITISLGILIDNTIVMADHLRNGKGIGVFRAIVAATLTTMGALIAVFFLDEDMQLRLLDFAWVIIINLGVSLVISLFFIPALIDKLPLVKRKSRNTIKRNRTQLTLTHWYGNTIAFTARFRCILLLIAILCFGLPVNKLPSYLKGEEWYIKWYNNTLGSQVYTEEIKPITDVALGGTLRLFTDKVTHNALSNSNRRTSISVSATMNDGSTLEQTNSIFDKLENFLAQYDEIEQFETRISSPSSASINILFKPEFEFDGFPYTLKSQLETKVIELGSADWSVTGVGRGFDNSLNEAYRNSRIQLYGYNLESLKNYAQKIKNYLVEIPRVEENSIFTNGRSTSGNSIHREYFLELDQERMRRTGISTGRMLNGLRELSNDEDWVMSVTKDNSTQYVYLTPERASVPDFWKINNYPVEVSQTRTARLDELGSFTKEREQDLINKENMEYTMVVEFNFIGSQGQKKYIIGQVEKRIEQELPIGYRIKQQYYQGGFWHDQEEDHTQLWLLLLIAGIIFFICAIVFESLLQPLAVLMMIPLTFIGVFLTFYWFDLGFDQGGYASLLLLSGLTVNSALYILNELNNIRKRYPNLSAIKSYLKAFNNKIVPIILTILSTVLGLVPFLSGGKKEAFWFSLAAGTIGGLIFSLLAIVMILPLFEKGIRKKRDLRKKRKNRKGKKKEKAMDIKELEPVYSELEIQG
nr:efflux RND transporter permease subunit [uncultured Carboxylicivirga sp.]